MASDDICGQNGVTGRGFRLSKDACAAFAYGYFFWMSESSKTAGRAGRKQPSRKRIRWLSWPVRIRMASSASFGFAENFETPRFQSPRHPGPGFAPAFEGSGATSHCSCLTAESGLAMSPKLEYQS